MSENTVYTNIPRPGASEGIATSSTDNNSGPDLSAGGIPAADRQSGDDVLGYKKWEARSFLGFKIIAFTITIILGTKFLWNGLTITTGAISHIQMIQSKQVLSLAQQTLKTSSASNEVVSGQIPSTTAEGETKSDMSERKILADKSKNDLSVPRPSKVIEESEGASSEGSKAKATAESKEPTKGQKGETKENDSFSTAMVSMGSIVTLIAFIFGVGLTLFLTLLKFIFTANSDSPTHSESGVTLATPLSEILQEFFENIKKRLGMR